LDVTRNSILSFFWIELKHSNKAIVIRRSVESDAIEMSSLLHEVIICGPPEAKE
jgi:hypothetical protein